MDNLLCDELLQEIFQRLPQSSSSSSAVSLVSKRWLFLTRTSTTRLSLRLPSLHPSFHPSLSSFLSQFPRLSSLTILSQNSISHDSFPFSHDLLLSVSSISLNLRHFRFLATPLSPSSLISLSSSSSSKNLSSLYISLYRPLSFRWLLSFPSLKDLSVIVSGPSFGDDGLMGDFDFDEEDGNLGLESLYLSGIGVDDRGMGWLWRSCKKLQRLQLRSCEGIGDGGSFSSFVFCLKSLQEVQLRACRSIADGVLLRLAEHCGSLNSVLLHDGSSRDSLRHFLSRCRSALQRLDLRLPLDLDNDHLHAVAENLRGLVSLRLESCCLVTGEGLKNLGTAMGEGLEELALINCDVVEREPGLLTTLGQNLRRLRKLNLSYNEMLLDKELVSMLVSCNNLLEIQLKGCRGLKNAAITSMFKNCKLLESIDITQCCGIGAEAVEIFILNSPRLRQVLVEESKLSDVAKTWVSRRFIEVVG